MIWDKISKPSSLHVDSLWLRLQKEFNTQMRVLILEGDRNHFEESLRMVLDDDKYIATVSNVAGTVSRE